MKPDIPMCIRGFQFAGIHCGIKESSQKLDLSLVYSDVPCALAGVFTINRVQAAPVQLSLKKIKNPMAQALLINSGNANACTGRLGLHNAERMSLETAKLLGLSPEMVYVSSTGKIGVQLPIEKICQGITRLKSSLSETGLESAARAILTTDRFTKIHGVQGKVGKEDYTLVGFAKGAGMIAPQMKRATYGAGGKHATMLAYFMTDLAIAPKFLQPLFEEVVEDTFNCITVDGDMSTNDTALVLANGRAGNEALKGGIALRKFQRNLEEVARVLALKMVEDGEGATKVVEIVVKRAKTDADAKKVAYAVAKSELVKTSFFGQDPNWGRVIAAVGYSGGAVDPTRIDIYYGPVQLVASGVPTAQSAEAKAHQVMKAPLFTVTVDLKGGKFSARVWTSDLNYDYIKINAEYRT